MCLLDAQNNALRFCFKVVDGFRELTADLSEKHFQSAHLIGQANRVEFLPVNWHATLHGQAEGTDERLKPLTLKAIPKLRNFVNDTLLDILFYTSPVYCQKILDTVVGEINRMHALFMSRNEGFKGKISIMGHSLGSLIVFDILSHQKGGENEQDVDGSGDGEGANSASEKIPEKNIFSLETIAEVFDRLDLAEFADKFSSEGIDLESLLQCNEDDLKEAGLPLGPRKRLMKYIAERKEADENGVSGLEAYQRSSVTSEVKYEVGPAGTGQPSVQYPKLCFSPSAFYALGSPIGMFLSVRGITSLGSNFRFETCPKFFNIFHPYDPVAYRFESLLSEDFAKLRPVVIPHHKGRKRMHLELKDTVTKLMTTDIKRKIIDSLSSTLSTVYNIATGTNPTETEEEEARAKAALEDSMTKEAEEAEREDESNPRTLDGCELNDGLRIDYALQEAPLESFNEYLFALASHLVYWESEDTCLMVLKEIYASMGVASDEAKAAGNAPPYLDTSSRPPVLNNVVNQEVMMSNLQQSSTPILMPPPTPMGSGMTGPATRINPKEPPSAPPTFTPTTSSVLAPPPTPASLPPTSLPSAPPPVLPPSANTPNMANLSLGPPSVSSNTPTGPPPLMMAPPSMGNTPTSKPMGGYPKPNLYPSTPSSTSGAGMDPTAPVMGGDRPLAPPPMAGFYQKK